MTNLLRFLRTLFVYFLSFLLSGIGICYFVLLKTVLGKYLLISNKVFNNVLPDSTTNKDFVSFWEIYLLINVINQLILQFIGKLYWLRCLIFILENILKRFLILNAVLLKNFLTLQQLSWDWVIRSRSLLGIAKIICWRQIFRNIYKSLFVILQCEPFKKSWGGGI